MAVDGFCEQVDTCSECGSERFILGRYGYEPYDGCEGEAVPHSDRCSATGGETDFEDFLRGEWLDHVEEPDNDPMDWTCECVREYWNGEDREHWTTLYVKHIRETMPDQAEFTADEAHRQYQLAHAKHAHEVQRKEMEDA